MSPVTDDDVGRESQRKGMACAAVCGDDEIVVTQKGAGFFQVGQVAIGKDDDTFYKQKILRRRRMA